MAALTPSPDTLAPGFDPLEMLKRQVRTLSDAGMCDLASYIAHQLSWSYGSDKISDGVAIVREDLREEAEACDLRRNGPADPYLSGPSAIVTGGAA
jgi:hypothetical protein